MYTVSLCLFETIDKFLLFSFAFDLSVLIAGVETINLTSGRNLRIKSRNFFSYLNIFSAVGKEASLVPINSIIRSISFISNGIKQCFILAILAPGK